MPTRKKYHHESEVPTYLKEKGIPLALANKWQQYYVEGCEKNAIQARYYAWLKFLANYRRRKEGWVKAAGQWAMPDRASFADQLWGIWHECKRKHFPTEVEWLDNFIQELIKVRNGILTKEEEEVPEEKELEAYLDDGEEPPAYPTTPEEEEEERDEKKPTPPKKGEEVKPHPLAGMPPAEEDDGSDEQMPQKSKKRLKRKNA